MCDYVVYLHDIVMVVYAGINLVLSFSRCFVFAAILLIMFLGLSFFKC